MTDNGYNGRTDDLSSGKERAHHGGPTEADHCQTAPERARSGLGKQEEDGSQGARVRSVAAGREAEELQDGCGESPVEVARTPLFEARNAERYRRQSLIKRYKELTGANLVTFIDSIYPDCLVQMEDILYDCDQRFELHVLLASPGGDGETALKIIRLMHSHCSKLTIVVPDMAKSAATIICLGADEILMGPVGDLGPIDPQMVLGGGRSMASAKEIVAALDEAERRVNENPNSFPLFSSLLSDVNMLMIEQARSALDRSESLMREALSSLPRRKDDEIDRLSSDLKAPLIDDPSIHSAVFSADDAARYGLPVKKADVCSEQWRIIWNLWTSYYAMGCFPAGNTSVYEGLRASNVLRS